jgi:hypothetical protein
MMPFFEREEVLAILSPHMDHLRQIVTGAWDEYMTLPQEIRLKLRSTARAANVRDFMVDRAIKYFSQFDDVAIRELKKLWVFLINDKVCIRFKKLTDDLESRNQPTRQVYRWKGQMALTGIDAPCNLDVGYVLDEIEQCIKGIYAVCVKAKGFHWFADLTTGSVVYDKTLDIFHDLPEEEDEVRIKRKESALILPFVRDGDENKS